MVGANGIEIFWSVFFNIWMEGSGVGFGTVEEPTEVLGISVKNGGGDEFTDIVWMLSFDSLDDLVDEGGTSFDDEKNFAAVFDLSLP